MDYGATEDVPENACSFGAIALSYPPIFIDDSGAEFHAD